jgi:hypothetical protein
LRAIESFRLRLNLGHEFARPVTVRALVEPYLEHELPQRRHSTMQSHSSALNRWISPRWGDHLLEQVKPVAVEEWLRSLPLAPKTKVNLRSLFHLIYQHARRWELTDRNPIDLVRQSGGRRSIPRVLTSDEIRVPVDGHPTEEKSTDSGLTNENSRRYGRGYCGKNLSLSGAGHRSCGSFAGAAEVQLAHRPAGLGIRQPPWPTAGTAEYSAAASEDGSVTGRHWENRLAHISTFLLNYAARCRCGYEGAAGAAETFNHPEHDEYLHPGGLGTEARGKQPSGRNSAWRYCLGTLSANEPNCTTVGLEQSPLGDGGPCKSTPRR